LGTSGIQVCLRQHFSSQKPAIYHTEAGPISASFGSRYC
jgi:hypothetical protein